jgi:hypothetical protein
VESSRRGQEQTEGWYITDDFENDDVDNNNNYYKNLLKCRFIYDITVIIIIVDFAQKKWK